MSDWISVWLDDHCSDGEVPGRLTPEGWIGVETPQEVIDLLKTNTVVQLSLDNDVGLFDDGSGTPWEGYHVLDELERLLVTGIITTVPTMYAHTSNASAKLYMHKLIRKIYAWRDARDGHES